MSLCQRSRHDLERIDPCQISLNRISLEEYFSRWLELQRRIVVEIYRPIWIVEEKNSHNYSIFLFTIDRPSSFHGFYPIFRYRIFRSDSANRSREEGKKKKLIRVQETRIEDFRVFSRALLLYYSLTASRGPLHPSPSPFTFMFYDQAVPRAPQKPTFPPRLTPSCSREIILRDLSTSLRAPLLSLSAPFDLKVTRLPDKG